MMNNDESLEDFIPVGKKNRLPMEHIMLNAKIFTKDDFKKQLSDLKRHKIIIFEEGGYYRAGNKEELLKFIKRSSRQSYELNRLIQIAYNEMEKYER